MDPSLDIDMDEAVEPALEADPDIDMTDGDSESDDMTIDIKPETAVAASKTFLDFPENVRARIYHYAGLVRACPINVATEKKRIKNYQHSSCAQQGERRDIVGNWNTVFGAKLCDHPPFPVNIFLVSRAIYHDASSVFYSQNNFRVSLRNREDSSTFYESTRPGLKHLRSLHVDLHPYDNRIIKAASTAGAHRALLNLWRKFSKIMAQEMPGLKDFSIKCRVKDTETAEKIVERIKPFPLLTGCAFHFSALPIEDVSAIAKKAVLDATTVPRDTAMSQPFPFQKLPKELQLMILGHLLTVRWDPFVQSSKSCAGVTTLQSRKDQRIQEINSLMCCGTCSVTRSVCFCSFGQTVVSSHCSCFTSPLSYFLVNREMYEDVRDIFYSKNRFAFVEEDPDYMMRFFHPFSNATLTKIRHLTLKFPSVYRVAGKPSPKLERTMQLSWSMLLRFVKEHLVLERLSLVVVDLGTFHSALNAQQERNQYLHRLLKLFVTLRGLQSFRVFLIDEPTYERKAEQAVMGPKYKSRKRNVVPFYGEREVKTSRS